MCSLQRMAEASLGQCWTTESGTMVPKVSSMVKTFMTATGMHMAPHVIRQCWPTPHDKMPVQNFKGIRDAIVHRLDEVVMQCPSTTTWDRFAFPLADQNCWQEEVLCHYLGKVLDVGTHMPGFRLMLQNKDGHYTSMAHTLKFEGSMFIYDPQQDITQWVPVGECWLP